MPALSPYTSTVKQQPPVEKRLDHPQLRKLLQKAYSAEKAAAYAYQGHAASVKDPMEKAAIRQIEEDEWNHRKEVLAIMNHYNIPVLRWYEIRFALVGRTISASCHVIGWFMPLFFAGKLESGNVCEYFRMKQYFNAIAIHDWDHILYEMGIKEKEHEVYFLEKIKQSRFLPFFERIFNWGRNHSANNVRLDKKYPVEESGIYCKK
jgi:rubrerythrin